MIGIPAHQFHHEIRPARVGRAGIEHARDVRMIHQRERLPLRLEARDEVARVESEFDQLERDAPAHGLLLLGHVDDAARALADVFEQLVMTDAVARHRYARRCTVAGVDDPGARTGLTEAGHRRQIGTRRRSFEKSTVLLVAAQQLPDVGGQRAVVRARAIDKRFALTQRLGQGFDEDRFLR